MTRSISLVTEIRQVFDSNLYSKQGLLVGWWPGLVIAPWSRSM